MEFFYATLPQPELSLQQDWRGQSSFPHHLILHRPVFASPGFSASENRIRTLQAELLFFVVNQVQLAHPGKTQDQGSETLEKIYRTGNYNHQKQNQGRGEQIMQPFGERVVQSVRKKSR